MKVLVDTSIWSIAFRRPVDNRTKEEEDYLSNLKILIEELRVVLIGPIRQEILSGISDEKQFSQLRDKLKAFDDLPIISQDYELAAEFYNTCRNKGVQGSHIDFLICTVAHRNKLLIFTTDQDFVHYSKHINIQLYNPHRAA
ncbi:MAG: PIN domain-containing protein [Actinobacteria bacterium]|nr:PIN domain-containing protein [Actinomycetota bacterium]